MTRALAFLHEKGICHGDFHLDNLSMTLKPEVDGIGYEKMKERVGNSVGELLLDDDKRIPHAPKHAHPSIDLIWGRIPKPVSDNAIIVDFGEVLETPNSPGIFNIPTGYASPEWLFGKQFGVGSDLWSWLMDTYDPNCRGLSSAWNAI